jgi:pimeloyl-ACP methyl ester carboxylesterase
MRTQLITLPTDGIPMDGALHLPDGPIRGSVLYFHGNTMNFYTGAARFLAPALTDMGLAFLAFNRRGHDILTTRLSREPEGGAFQTVSESVADNQFAAQWMNQQGFSNPIIIGHSYGGMLATRHVAEHPETPGLVLLSAGRGGRENVSGGREKLFAMDQTETLKARAESLVAAGQGHTLMQLPGWWWVISAQSFLDRLLHVPDTLSLIRQINCPVLALRGDLEDKSRYPAEEFQAACKGPCDVIVIPNCDHFYNGREEEISKHVSQWIKTNLAASY